MAWKINNYLEDPNPIIAIIPPEIIPKINPIIKLIFKIPLHHLIFLQ